MSEVLLAGDRYQEAERGRVSRENLTTSTHTRWQRHLRARVEYWHSTCQGDTHHVTFLVSPWVQVSPFAGVRILGLKTISALRG